MARTGRRALYLSEAWASLVVGPVRNLLDVIRGGIVAVTMNRWGRMMALGDVLATAEGERAEAQRMEQCRPSQIRLPEDLWSRLDVIAEELGWSRNRLMLELLEEASCDLAALMARDEAGRLDPDRFGYLTGFTLGGDGEVARPAEPA